jgi:hypothetical protein|tara:strand:+ start:1073 stop:1654 length:582 start_codon:yes stop_codon:yes gene_type:complete
MADFFEETFDAAEALESVDPDKTKTLSNLVRQLDDVNANIQHAEDELKKLKAERNRLATDSIPNLLDDMEGTVGIEVKASNGDILSLSINTFVSASIPPDRKQEAYDWLRENNLDSIIKNEVILGFGAREDKKAQKVLLDLENQGYHPESKTHIHAMTLKGFVRERVENGLPIDLDLFGAYVGQTAVIKRKTK